MALEDDPNGSPGMVPMDPYTAPVDPYQWPPPEWLGTTLGPRGVSTIDPVPPPPPPAPPHPPLPGELSKHIGPSLTPGGEEVPFGGTPPMPLPDYDPVADADPRLDMTKDELAAKQAAPPQLGEMEPMQVGSGIPLPKSEAPGNTDVVPQGASFSELPSDVEKQNDNAALDQLYKQTGASTAQDKSDVADFYYGKKQQDQMRAQVQQARDDDFKAQNENYARQQTALIKSQQDLAQIDSDAKKISTLNPNRWMQSRSTGQMIAAGIASFIGGFESFNTGGRNTGLDMIQKAIDQDTEAQKFNIAQQQNQIAQRRASVSEKLGLDIDAYKAAEAHRAALYDHAIGQIQTAAQDYDSNGSMARQAAQYVGQLQAQRQMGLIEGQTKLATLRKTQADAEHTEAETLKLGAETAKLAAPGVGSATNPNYTVPTGLFDPFTKQPIYSKDKIKDVGEVKGAIDSYRKVQDQYAKLQAIARRVNGHYSQGAQVWKRFQSTDEAEYNQTRSGLLMSILHARGERPNKDALEAQGVLVPDLTKVLGSTDTVKMLDDSQSDNDRDIAGFLNLSGVNGDQMIANAQRMRQPPPEPKLDDSITAANEAVETAKTPAEKRDALAAVDAAQKKAAQAAADVDMRKAAVGAASQAVPMPRPSVAETAPPDIKAINASMADAVDTYNQAVVAFHTLQTRKAAPSQKELEDAAVKVTSAKRALDELQAHAAPRTSHISGDENIIDTTFHAY